MSRSLNKNQTTKGKCRRAGYETFLFPFGLTGAAKRERYYVATEAKLKSSVHKRLNFLKTGFLYRHFVFQYKSTNTNAPPTLDLKLELLRDKRR